MNVAPFPLKCWASNAAAVLASNGWNGVNQCLTLRDIATVGTIEGYYERDALRFGNEMVLCTWSRAVGGIRVQFLTCTHRADRGGTDGDTEAGFSR